jgi:hypothetical protein
MIVQAGHKQSYSAMVIGQRSDLARIRKRYSNLRTSHPDLQDDIPSVYLNAATPEHILRASESLVPDEHDQN